MPLTQEVAHQVTCIFHHRVRPHEPMNRRLLDPGFWGSPGPTLEPANEIPAKELLRAPPDAGFRRLPDFGLVLDLSSLGSLDGKFEPNT